jgi:hypothetical protein
MAVANNPTYKDATTIIAVRRFIVQALLRVLVKRPEDTDSLKTGKVGNFLTVSSR